MPYTELPPPPTYETMPLSSNNGTDDGPLTDPLLEQVRPTNSRHRRHPSSFQLEQFPDHSNHSNSQRNNNGDPSNIPTASTNSIRQRGRILDRDADFYQSRGRWSGVELLPRASGRRNRSSLSTGIHPSRRRLPWCGGCKRLLRRWLPRLWEDWFHTLAYQRTLLLMTILFVTYSAIVVAFGFLYLTVSIMGTTRELQPDGSYVTHSFCDMEIENHMEALYFSLSTMTTIGYGVSDYYFGGCWTPLIIVLMQVCTAITFDAVAVGLLFTRLSRGRKRSKTVVVSNQAVVQVVQGVPYFMLRVGELRRFPLIDASVKLFCIRHERIPRHNIMLQALPSTRMVMTGSPPADNHHHQNTHRTVSSSTAAATTVTTASPQQQQPTDHDSNMHHPLPNRSVITPQSSTTTASTTKVSNQTPPPPRIHVDTTPFVTRPMKQLHADDGDKTHSNYILMSLPQVIVHRMDHYETSPLVPPPVWYDARGQQHTYPPPNPDQWLDANQRAIQNFWNDRGVEIVVLVEGTDELTGAAIQTRHSYSASSLSFRDNHHDSDRTAAEEEGDVLWNRAFANCILPYHADQRAAMMMEEDEEDVENVTTRSSRFRRRRHNYPVCTVDFERFHDTVPVPRDCLASPYVP